MTQGRAFMKGEADRIRAERETRTGRETLLGEAVLVIPAVDVELVGREVLVDVVDDLDPAGGVALGLTDEGALAGVVHLVGAGAGLDGGKLGALVTSGPKVTRFSLYVYARQQGTWMEMLGVAPDDEPALSLSSDDIAALPPTFIAASTDDQDVPFKTSKTLSRAAPNARMITAYYLEHDFDRDTSNPAGAQAYAAALAFLDAQTAADA